MEKELSSHSKTFISVEDYFRIEETALRKSEYFNGEMTEMPGVSREHTLIVTNFVSSLERSSWIVLTKSIPRNCD